MKQFICIAALACFGTVLGQTKDVKVETEQKIIKIEDNKGTTEKKVSVTTRETADVKLDDADKNKVNQDRIQTTAKVEKTISVDNDADASYDAIKTETFYKNETGMYMLMPSETGYVLAVKNKDDKYVENSKILKTSTKGQYLIKNNAVSGMGYFDEKGNFIVHYLSDKDNTVSTQIYHKQ